MCECASACVFVCVPCASGSGGVLTTQRCERRISMYVLCVTCIRQQLSVMISRRPRVCVCVCAGGALQGLVDREGEGEGQVRFVWWGLGLWSVW